MTYGYYPSIVAALRAQHQAEDHRGAGGVCRDAADEIEHLHRLIAWCRLRLSKDVYRTSLDDQLVNPRQNDGSTITNGER